MRSIASCLVAVFMSGAACHEPPPRGALTSPPVAPQLDAGSAAGIPTRAMPCGDDTTELVVAHLPRGDAGFYDEVTLLCWGERCLNDGVVVTRPPPLPAPATPEPTVVQPTRVCTGARCDALGRRLAARLAMVGGDADVQPVLFATDDHGAVVLLAEPLEQSEVWDRARDRKVVLVQPAQVPGHPTSLVSLSVLGDRVLAGWDCEEYCNATGALFDAHGKQQGAPFELAPGWGTNLGPRSSQLMTLGPQRFLVFARFGAVTFIDHGRPGPRANLESYPGHAPREIDVQTQLLDDGAGVGLLWCEAHACHVGRLEVSAGSEGPVALDLHEDAVLPRCESSP